MLEFHVGVRLYAGCAIVTIVGELDIATAPQLTVALDEAWNLQADRVIVDLRDTSFVDSTGLTTLFRAHRCNDGRFAIVCAHDNLEVRRVIELMGFDGVFTIHESLAAAGCEDGAGTGS